MATRYGLVLNGTSIQELQSAQHFKKVMALLVLQQLQQAQTM